MTETTPRTKAGRALAEALGPGDIVGGEALRVILAIEAEVLEGVAERVRAAERDLTDDELDRLADAMRRADYVNWTAAELAPLIAGTVRAIFAARLALLSSTDRETT